MMSTRVLLFANFACAALGYRVQSDAGVPYDAGKPDNLKTSYRAGESNKLQEVAELLLANNPSGLGTRHRLPSMAHRRAHAHMLGNEDFQKKQRRLCRRA